MKKIILIIGIIITLSSCNNWEDSVKESNIMFPESKIVKLYYDSGNTSTNMYLINDTLNNRIILVIIGGTSNTYLFNTKTNE